jgi:hypothetical protein
MTEQEFFDKLEEIHKEQPFVYTSRGTIRQMNTDYCPITAVAGKSFTLPDHNAAEINFQWHLCSSLLELDYTFAREIIRAADYVFIDPTDPRCQEQQRIKDKLLATTKLPAMTAVPTTLCYISSTNQLRDKLKLV